jgi:exodeoxyribonuclease V alpha subunit
LRAEQKELIDLGQSINNGDIKSTLSILNGSNSVIHSLPFCSNLQNLLEYAKPFFTEILEGSSHPQNLIQAFSRFRILSPLRKGAFGVDELNKMFNLFFSKKFSAAPIMLTSNDYRLNLINGEIGILIRSNGNFDSEDFQEGDVVFFPSQKEGEPFRKIPALLLPKYEYAYALSVHKSQGSEFDHVLLLLPPGSEVFGREVLYTAVTRARKRLDIWGDEEIIQKTLEKQSIRLSGLKEKIQFN